MSRQFYVPLVFSAPGKLTLLCLRIIIQIKEKTEDNHRCIAKCTNTCGMICKPSLTYGRAYIGQAGQRIRETKCEHDEVVVPIKVRRTSNFAIVGIIILVQTLNNQIWENI